jgi:hypothetical protein
MRRTFYGLVVTLLVPGWQASTKAQDVVPAGTLLQCTLDEPNFSSATANVGDPIVCQLSSIEEFGHSQVTAADLPTIHPESLAAVRPDEPQSLGCLIHALPGITPVA